MNTIDLSEELKITDTTIQTLKQACELLAFGSNWDEEDYSLILSTQLMIDGYDVESEKIIYLTDDKCYGTQLSTGIFSKAMSRRIVQVTIAHKDIFDGVVEQRQTSYHKHPCLVHEITVVGGVIDVFVQNEGWSRYQRGDTFPLSGSIPHRIVFIEPTIFVETTTNPYTDFFKYTIERLEESKFIYDQNRTLGTMYDHTGTNVTTKSNSILR